MTSAAKLKHEFHPTPLELTEEEEELYKDISVYRTNTIRLPEQLNIFKEEKVVRVKRLDDNTLLLKRVRIEEVE